jgi:hypothetical protein
MTAHTPRPSRLRQLLASLRRARPTTDAPGTPDLWLAGLRLGG